MLTLEDHLIDLGSKEDYSKKEAPQREALIVDSNTSVITSL